MKIANKAKAFYKCKCTWENKNILFVLPFTHTGGNMSLELSSNGEWEILLYIEGPVRQSAIGDK